MSSSSTSRRAVIGGAVSAVGATGTAAIVGTEPAAANTTGEPSRYERGLRMLRQVSGEAGLDVIESLREISPALARYVVEFPYGDIYPRPHLDLPQRQLVIIGALTAFGDTAPQQNVHIHAALNVGLAPGQIIEALIQCVPFAGFPRVLNAISVAREVFAERGIELDGPR